MNALHHQANSSSQLNKKPSNQGDNLKYAKIVDTRKEKASLDKKESSKNSQSKTSSSEISAANVGFRNGFYPRLQGYHPQWMSASMKQQQEQAIYLPEQQHPRVSSFRMQSSNEQINDKSNIYNANSSKLKYSESARTNPNFFQKEKGKSTQDLSSRPSSNYASQKVPQHFQNIYEETSNNEFQSEDSQFILKPANSSSIYTNASANYKNQILVQDPSYIGNLNRDQQLAGTYIDVVSSSKQNKSKKTLSNYNPLNDYSRQASFKSDPNLNANKYSHHDVYYWIIKEELD